MKFNEYIKEGADEITVKELKNALNKFDDNMIVRTQEPGKGSSISLGIIDKARIGKGKQNSNIAFIPIYKVGSSYA